jgi:hypothetical protein
MPRKRDGPAPRKTALSQGQKETRAPPLPGLKTPRNTRALPTPSQSRVRRRPDDPSWREFRVRLFSKPDSEGVHALHVYLRTMARRFGLEIAEIDEVHDHEKDR